MVLRQLEQLGMGRCLSPNANQSRVYGLTSLGRRVRDACLRRYGRYSPAYDEPDIDWESFSWLCYAHRRPILLAMDEIMRPPVIRRRVRFYHPRVRMSEKHVREVLPSMVARELVERVWVRKQCYPSYRLTAKGRQIQEVLRRVDDQILADGSAV